jgi:cobalt-zinc-cadmium efflux system membrane fusion protein
MKNIFIQLLGVVMLLSCSQPKNKETQEKEAIVNNKITLTDAQSKNIKIELVKLENRALSSIIQLNGKIDVPPQNLISVSMPMGGFLKSTRLLPGMHIKKGESLAIMEDQLYIDLQQQYLTAKSKLIFMENEYNRQKELNQSKAASDKYFQQAEMDFVNQKIMVNALSEKLKLININPELLNESTISRSITINSPIDGFVSKVNANIGKYTSPSDILFELINPNDIHLNLKVFEKDLDKLSIGQKVMAYSNSAPDKKHPCEIILISQNLSEDRSADVHCHFEDYDKSLFPGMYMNAEVRVSNNNVLSINEDAIVTFEGKDFVFVSIGGNQYEMTEIRKGVSENNFIEITLSRNEFLNYPFVKKGAYSLLMQLKNKSNE